MKKTVLLLIIILFNKITYCQYIVLLNKSYSDMLNKQASVGGVETPKTDYANDGGFSVYYKCTIDDGTGKEASAYHFNAKSICTAVSIIHKVSFEDTYIKFLNKTYQYGSNNTWFSPSYGLQFLWTTNRFGTRQRSRYFHFMV